MPNRLIREGMLESEAVLSLPVDARWLYLTILLSADDVGLFEATEFRLARKADVRRELAGKLLALLADVDLVRLYSVGAKTFGFLPKFRQRIQIKRIKHPMPPAALYADDQDAINKFNDLARKTTDGKQLRNRSADVGKPSEPEPEPEPKEEKNIAPSVLFPTTPVGDGSAPTPKAKRTRKPKADAAPSVSTLVWDAYSTAYRAKYRIDPVRNAAVNGQIANFVSRIPSEEAPDVATFYLGHKNPLYLNAAHAVNLLVRDAEKLRMEWATGQQIMPAEKLTFRQRDIADKTARVAEIGGTRIAAKNAATYSADPFTLENEPHDAPRLD